MTNNLKFSLAAALLASFSFAGTASAEGDYYESAFRAAVPVFDMMETGSVAARGVSGVVQIAAVDSGDYYRGANRPK